MEIKSYKIREKGEKDFWKYKRRFVKVFMMGKNYNIGIRVYGKNNKDKYEIIANILGWNNIEKVKDYIEKNSNKKIELIKD